MNLFTIHVPLSFQIVSQIKMVGGQVTDRILEPLSSNQLIVASIPYSWIRHSEGMDSHFHVEGVR